MTAKRYGRMGIHRLLALALGRTIVVVVYQQLDMASIFIRYHVAADICSRVKYQNQTVQAGDAVIHGILEQAVAQVVSLLWMHKVTLQHRLTPKVCTRVIPQWQSAYCDSKDEIKAAFMSRTPKKLNRYLRSKNHAKTGAR